MEDILRAKRWIKLRKSSRVWVERNRVDRILWDCKGERWVELRRGGNGGRKSDLWVYDFAKNVKAIHKS